MSDYINIVVGYEIYPSDESVTLGDIICYNTPLETTTGNECLNTLLLHMVLSQYKRHLSDDKS